MAKKTTKPKKEEESRPIRYCSECTRFVRDTEGISRSQETGEYFMGKCSTGLHPDTPKKQFANKPRFCEKFRRV